MKDKLLDFLICPACLPEERDLACRIWDRRGGEIVTGSLSCGRCGTTYPIQEGIGILLSAPDEAAKGAQAKYETSALVASYLWSHYADLWGDEDASTAYRAWSDCLKDQDGFSLDAGCAVGRFTFEMSLKSDFAVGIDRSIAFVRAARQLAAEGTRDILLPEEGLLKEKTRIELPEKWNGRKVEFLVADAQALPFRSGRFSSIASLNLVDKLPLPYRHLEELNRCAREKEVQFLFSDPFSWTAEIAPEEDWLGGTGKGPFKGKGMENIVSLLTGGEPGFRPEWMIDKRGEIWWKIRNHRNHFELIRSCFLHARR